MEAINSLASTATKAIWGENQTQGQEPVSGKQGDTSKGEPYDAGNMEPAATAEPTTSSTTKTTEPTTSSATKTTEPTTASATKTTEPTTAPATKADEPNPAKEKDSSNMAGDSTKAQNDTRSPEEEKKTEDTVPAEDLKGPGPRPVAELAKEHGGDAGAVGKDASSSSSGMLEGSDVPAPTGTGAGEANAEKTEGPGAVTETKDHEEKKKSKEEEGTGEQYVKSSGLNADGGDFDATKPGAGREAERLLEEKGIHHTPGKKPEPAAETTTNGKSAPGSTSPETKEKKSLGERIKAKLHHKDKAAA